MIPVPSQVGSGFLVGSCPGRMGGPISGNACAPVMPAPRVGTRGPSVDVGAPKPLKGFDAHFHLDRMRAHMKSTPKTRVDHAAQQPRVPITVTGGVRNYCDPETYHTMPIAVNHPWHMAIGIHPKKAQTYTAEQWDFFERKLALSLVTGILAGYTYFVM